MTGTTTDRQQAETTAPNEGISVLVPCYNEERAIGPVLEQLDAVMGRLDRPYEIIVVDDGSTDRTADRVDPARYQLLRHPTNQGYGAALKTAAAAARHDIIVITDADGTYPNEMIPELVAALGAVDGMNKVEMVVGARTGDNVHIPPARRPAKWALTQLANYLTGTRIPDLNSGLRVIRRELWERFEYLFPDGFSLTTTITLAALANRRKVLFIPIDYHPRVGQSKIRPIRATLDFVQLILRTVLYFNPLKVFVPLSLILFLASMVIGAGSLILQYLGLDQFMDVTTSLLFIAAIQTLALGALADLISKQKK